MDAEVPYPPRDLGTAQSPLEKKMSHLMGYLLLESLRVFFLDPAICVQAMRSLER